MHLNAKPYTQPDIRLFQSQGKRHDPFAKFDYMGVPPTLNALNRHLRLCDMFRDNGHKLPKKFLECELRAYLAIKNNEYVTTDYSWKHAITDCWLTTPETWWEDFKKHAKTWG